MRAAHRAALQREEATRTPPRAVISQDGPDAAPQQPHEPISDARVADSNLSDPQDTFNDPATERNTVSESVEPKIATDETGDNDESPVEFPVISPVDFETDDEFGNMYKYLTREELTGHSRTDKTALIMADRYTVKSGLLYRIDAPRQKRLRDLKPVTTRLCVPKRFRHEILAYVHNRCGHYAAQALFHTLAARYFWKKLFSDAVAYCTTCSSCQKTKINYSHRYVPLHPLRVPDELGSRFSMDHKILTRTTKLGNTAILVVECFSNFAHLPVRDTTAEVTARALVANIVPLWGIGWTLYSDKAPAFMSTLFAQVNKCLGIRHITSAARTARCNGMAEATVKRLSEHLKFYAKDDLSVEDAIPIIEMNLRATSLTKLMISPYEICFWTLFTFGSPWRTKYGSDRDEHRQTKLLSLAVAPVATFTQGREDHP